MSQPLVKRCKQALGILTGKYDIRRSRSNEKPLHVSALKTHNVAPDARLFCSREEILGHLPKNGRIVEVGVALGDFSQKMISAMSPEHFTAIDLFEWHQLETLWGKPASVLFQGKEHERFYRDRFHELSQKGRLDIRRGTSWEKLSELPDDSCDFIYIDAAHDYESVRKDILAAAPKVRRGGSIGLNDYTLYDVYHDSPYGVVQACNEFCVAQGWAITMMALEPMMFCDVVIMRCEDLSPLAA